MGRQREEFDTNATVPMPGGAFVTHYGEQVHFDGAKDEDAVLLLTTSIVAPKPHTPNVWSPDFRTSAMPSRSPLWRHDRVLFLVSGILVRRFRFGATMALGRSMIMMLRPLRRRRWSAISYGVIDNRSENLQH